MEFIVILILLFVWFFMIAPFIKLYKASKQWRNVFEQAQQQQRRQRQADGRRQQQPPVARKKIDPTVGEYVEFTETTEVTATATDGGAGSSIRVETEAQITDITWEDID